MRSVSPNSGVENIQLVSVKTYVKASACGKASAMTLSMSGKMSVVMDLPSPSVQPLHMASALLC